MAEAQPSCEAGDDHLGLASNETVVRMLRREAPDWCPDEVIHFSDFLVKINRKNKSQNRVLLVTDKAIYNLLPQDVGKCRRRIPLEEVGQVSVSDDTDEFVLHVPDEYDYRFSSSKKLRIAEILNTLYRLQTMAPLQVVVHSGDLSEVVITKPQAKLMSREERRLRRQEILAQSQDADMDADTQILKQIAEMQAGNGGRDPLDGPAAPTAADGRAGGPPPPPLIRMNTVVGVGKASLQDFEYLKLIGRGNFGKVILVRKIATKQLYAIKILKKDMVFAQNQVDHTRAERKILEALRHPFLSTLRYAFQTSDKLYLVLDFYSGGELFLHLKHVGKFRETAARLFVAEVALALGHLHSLDIVYRDLKPENILLDHDGHICLTDFGLSKDISDEPYAHTFCGTPEYLAPEVVLGFGHNKAVDWWALGILLYELLVGIPPFYSENVSEMYTAIKQGVLRLPSNLSRSCKSLLKGLLTRDPSKRLGSGSMDVEELKSHPFFDPIDWDKLMRKEITPIYKPDVRGDTASAPARPWAGTLVEDATGRGLLAGGDDVFSGFTFNGTTSFRN